ncbi:MAG: IniB N-terminal domain-containing protein [Mycobacterium sp.]
MSILDFTTDLFHDPTNLRAFIENGDRALRDAGLPDATPEQVYDLLPMVAESMPPEHPLQTVLDAPDLEAALQELDIEHFGELEPDGHLHGKAKVDGELDEGMSDKAFGGAPAPVGHHAERDAVGDGAADRDVIVEPVDGGKGLGGAADAGQDLAEAEYIRIIDDPLTPEIEVEIHESDQDHAVDEQGLDPEVGHAMWGKDVD